MDNISKYIETNLTIEEFTNNDNENGQEIKSYYLNAKADAIHCYSTIKKYLYKDKKILEVGGGIHLLTSFLNQEHDITSIEPGKFTNFTEQLRNQIIKKNKLKIHTTTLENFKTQNKFDFVFSMNVLEHTDDIQKHLNCCLNLLKDENSLLFIQCPNYTFPFEAHFCKWFIPFFPKFTFTKLRKKNLVKELGNEKYEEIIKNLNFNCTFHKIYKLNMSISFIHPLKDIFNRLDTDKYFRERLLKNSSIKFFVKLIKFFKLENLMINLFPKSLCPYLILKIKKF